MKSAEDWSDWMKATTMTMWRLVSTLTRTRAVSASQLQCRYRSYSLPWQSPAAAVDSRTHLPSHSDDDDDALKCPATKTSGRRRECNTSEARPMTELDGPPGWPIIGNFLTYLKQKNRGQMHLVQVSQE